MLNFLSQIFGKKHSGNQVVAPEREKVLSVLQNAKREALKEAEQLSNDESVIANFLMQCRFADARYVAAQKIYSKHLMEQVRTAMQKTDRRVYRLMQTRLNEMAHNDALLAQVDLLIGKAKALLDEAVLMPNLVADLDREWETIAKKGFDTLSSDRNVQFETLRAQLESRLSAQLALQRDVKYNFDALLDMDKNPALTPSERAELLQDFAGKLNHWKQLPERVSLPRKLLDSFETELTKLIELSERFQREFDAQACRMNWLCELEQSDVSQLNGAKLKKQWNALPEVKNKDKRDELNDRFHAVFARLPGGEANITDSLAQSEFSALNAQNDFIAHLDALQQAVESGAIHDAQIHDDALRQIDLDTLGASEEQREQLSQLRAEFRRLREWAKWSGQLSREKLIRFVQDLPEQKLEISALANAVMRAQEQWKSLNAVSGKTTREQWTQFNDACNLAYEPVLEQAKKQAEEREKNRRHAESMIEDIRAFVHRFESDWASQANHPDAFDWKTIINFYRQTMQLWRQLGLVGKKEKKRLDDLFSDVIRPIREKLYEQTLLEIGRRKQLIEEVLKIDPDQKNAGKMLRAVQEKWQMCAKAFPLDNREDKRLWTRFREVCEQLHIKRMEKNKANDLERQQHLKQKEAICSELELLHTENEPSVLERRLNELLNRWKNVGRVPREIEGNIQNRLDLAVSACREKIQWLRSEKISKALKALYDKLSLCRLLENRIVGFCKEIENGSVDAVSEDEELETAWKSLPALPEKMENVLSHRFYNGLKAMAGRNLAYGKRVLNNVSSMKENLLRFEIMFGLDSPKYLEQERLKKQMEMLQDALGGSNILEVEEVTRQLLEMPVFTEAEDIDRINTIILKLHDHA